MTSPTGGGANLGTAVGRVRVVYESTGSGSAVKQLEAVQESIVSAGKSAESATKSLSAAASQVNNFAAQTARIGKNIKNPAAGLGKQVENEVSKANKALSNVGKATGTVRGQKITLNPEVKINPRLLQIDQGAINRLAAGSLTQAITLKMPVKIAPTNIEIDQGAFDNLVQSANIGTLTIKAPIVIEPTDVQIDQNGLNAQATQAGSTAGDALAGGLTGKLGTLAKAAPVVGVIAGIGTALTAGFSRLQGLDQAAIKLKALGYEVNQIKSISNSALKSVEGTAFSLDEAFNTAANAISAGIKPGKELDEYLSATANTAALAGVSMQELGDAFSQAAVQGKLTGDIIQLLYSRNVPVLKLLADEYGVTQAKASEMVSNGEVDFNRFIDAMSKNGDAAKIMGNTVRGSFDNLMAAVKRTSAAFLAPIFGNANGEASTVALAIQAVTNKVKEFEQFLAANKQNVIGFWAGLAEVGIMTGHVVVSAISGIVGAVGVLAKGISWIPRLLANIADLTGKDKLAKDTWATADAMSGFGDQALKLGEQAWGANGSLDRLWETVQKWEAGARSAADATGDLGDAAGESGTQMLSLSEALEKFGVKDGAAQSAIEGTVADFKKLIETLKSKNAPKELIDAVTKLRNEFDNGGRAAKSYADAIDNMADQTIDASDKADALISSLQKLGLLPGGDALAEYNKQFSEMTDLQANLFDALGASGQALINFDGTINSSTGNGQKLVDVISQARDQLYSLAASGEVAPGEAFDRTSQGLQEVLKRIGIEGQAAQDIINKYLTPGGQGKAAFEAQFSGGTPQQILEETFKNDPAKLESVLDLLTTRQDIINEITGGPGASIKIPAELDVKDPNEKPELNSGWWPKTGPGSPDPGAMPDGIKPQVITPEDLSKQPGGGKFYRTKDGKRIWLANGQPVPMGAVEEGSQTPAPATTTVPLAPSAPITNINPTGVEDNKSKILEILNQNADLGDVLLPLIQQAEQQGKTFTQAFAEGIANGSPEVQDALLKLAQLAPDILGNSPAKYGPLSGKGWTKERGKVFTQAWAEGIESEASTAQSAVSSVAGGASIPLGSSMEQMVKDLAEMSSLGKNLFNFAKSLFDIGINIGKVANDLSGGRLFPKSYTPDPNFKPRGSALGPWSPTMLSPKGTPSDLSGAPSGATLPVGKVAPNAKGDDVAKAFIAQAQSRGWSQEQILAGLGVLNQETAYGTNPATNNVQNQNGTAGITGVFQQDMSYRKYGDPRDPNNAINGFITEFENRGGLTQNPWDFAVSGVQKPANVGAGGYWDRSGAGAGAYLRDKQRDQALEVYNRLTGGGGIPTVATTSAVVPRIDSSIPSKLVDSGSATSTPAGQQVAAILSQMFPGIASIGGSDNRPKGTPQMHTLGRALDIGIGEVTKENQAMGDQINAFLKANAEAFGIQSTIWRDVGTNFVQNEGGGPGTTYSASGHQNHIHAQFAPGAVADLSRFAGLPAGLPDLSVPGATPGGTTPVPVQLDPASSGALQQISSNTLGMPQAIQDLTAQNPALLEAIRGSQSTGLNQENAVGYLQSIDAAIADQNRLGTPQSKEIAGYLGRTRSQILDQTGLKEGPNALDQAAGLANGVSGIVGSAFQVFDSVIESIGSAKEISGTLVRGIENTEDIYNIIENIQSFIELGQNIAQLTSDVLGFASSITGGAAAGDPSGATSAVATALGAASGIAGIVAQGFAAVNAAIDIGQEIYRMAGKYFGRFLTNWVGLPGATDLKYLLDEQTGQLNIWSSDNPQNKKQFNTIGRQFNGSAYAGTDRTTPINQFTIYQGPGQDPRDTMSQAMFAIKTSGVGAFGYESTAA